MKKCKSTNRNRTAVICIISPPYSGSTLLSYLIAAHPDVGTIGERKHFWRKMLSPDVIGSQYCSCGKLFKECEFWLSAKSGVLAAVPPHVAALSFSDFQLYGTPILNKIARKVCLWYAVRHRTEYIPYPLNPRFKEVCEANKILINAILRTSNATAFLDSSKEIRHAVYLDSTEELDVFAVHLLRDGRGQLFSMLKRNKASTVEELSQQWVRNVSFQESITRRWNGRMKTVKYEDLCTYPEKTMERIFDFCLLDPHRKSLEFRDVEQHIMGNLGTRTDTANTISERQEWRSKLSANQLVVFDRIGGSLNRFLGYE